MVNLILFIIINLLSKLLVITSELSWNHTFFEKPKCLSVAYNSHENGQLLTAVSSYMKQNASVIMCENQRSVIFQHFIFCLLPYLNIITYLSDIGELSNQNIPKLLLKKIESNYFESIDHWIKSMFQQLTPVLGNFIELYNNTNEKSTYIAINRKIFPLDRSFTLRLSSFLNEVDICHEIVRVLKPSNKINVLVIDRKTTRKFINIKNMMQVVQDNNNVTVKLEYFENWNFSQQIDLIRSNDIIITAHGAAVANTFALPLCGQLIEIFPYGYCAESCFSNFNIDRHFMYSGVNKHHNCLKRLNFTTDDLPIGTCHPAMDTLHGRICLRKAHIEVNLTQLVPVFQSAVAKRLDCLKNNSLNYTGIF